jgi:hypothetical protein
MEAHKLGRFLTLFYTPIKKTFNTFKRFYADPAKNFFQYSGSWNNPLQYLILLTL